MRGEPRVIGAEDLAGSPRRTPKNEKIVPRARPTVADLEREAERDAAMLEVVFGSGLLFVLMWLSCWP